MQNEVTGDMLLEFLADTIKGVPIFSTAWTNPEPNEAYTPKSVDVGDHDAIFVIANVGTSGSETKATALIENGSLESMQKIGVASVAPNIVVRTRNVGYTENTANISEGYIGYANQAPVLRNDVMIPVKIYGIDFIGGGL